MLRRKSLSPAGHQPAESPDFLRKRSIDSQLPTLLIRDRSNQADVAARSPRPPQPSLRRSSLVGLSLSDPAPSDAHADARTDVHVDLRTLDLRPAAPLSDSQQQQQLQHLPPGAMPATTPRALPAVPPLSPLRTETPPSPSLASSADASLSELRQQLADMARRCTLLEAQNLQLRRSLDEAERARAEQAPVSKGERASFKWKLDEYRIKVDQLQADLSEERRLRASSAELADELRREQRERSALQQVHEQALKDAQTKELTFQATLRAFESQYSQQIVGLTEERNQLKAMVDGFVQHSHRLPHQDSVEETAMLTSLSRDNSSSSSEDSTFDHKDMTKKVKAMQAQIAALTDELKHSKELLHKRFTDPRLRSDSVRNDGLFLGAADKEQRPPTGKVTLVFTDVENSTSMWERDPESMTICLDYHNTLMRRAIHEFSGYEVKTEGDAFMIAFQESMDALHFCLTVQQRLVNDPWPDELEEIRALVPDLFDNNGVLLFRGLRVRMGIHTGLPLCQRDPNTRRMDYFGRMVNKAARIGSLALAGQILVSRDVVDEVERELDRLAAWRTLGRKLLKGFKDPEEVFQVLPSSLSGRTFPVDNFVRDEDLKFRHQLVSSRLDAILREHEALKQRFAGIESRLAQLDMETTAFATRLESLRGTDLEHCASDEEQSMLSRLIDEFEALKSRHMESRAAFETMGTQTSDLTTRINELNANVERLSAKEDEQEKDLSDTTGHILSYGALMKKCKALETSTLNADAERLSILAKLAAKEDEFAGLQQRYDSQNSQLMEARRGEMSMFGLAQSRLSRNTKLKAELAEVKERAEAAEERAMRLERQLDALSSVASPVSIPSLASTVSSTSSSSSYEIYPPPRTPSPSGYAVHASGSASPPAFGAYQPAQAASLRNTVQVDGGGFGTHASAAAALPPYSVYQPGQSRSLPQSDGGFGGHASSSGSGSPRAFASSYEHGRAGSLRNMLPADGGFGIHTSTSGASSPRAFGAYQSGSLRNLMQGFGGLGPTGSMSLSTRAVPQGTRPGPSASKDFDELLIVKSLVNGAPDG